MFKNNYIAPVKLILICYNGTYKINNNRTFYYNYYYSRVRSYTVVQLTGRMFFLTLISDGCVIRPLTRILPFTDRASSALSVLIPTLPCKVGDNDWATVNIKVIIYKIL